MSMHRTSAASLVSLCCLSISAFAAPTVSNVSGTLSAGQSVTVSGSSFGTKPQASPVLWDDFESGTSGQKIAGAKAKVGQWDTGFGSDYVTYSTAKPRTGTKSALNDFMSFYNASLAKNMTMPRLYMDFWILPSYVDNKSRNWKPWRMYGGSNDSLQLDYVYLCDGQLMNRVQDIASWVVGDWAGSTYSNNQWLHVQLIFNESTPGVANGTVRHFINSKVHGLNSSSVTTRIRAEQFNQLRIGHYWDKAAVDNCGPNSGAKVYVDDAYIDTSWARVELGNAPTYAESTQREIQLPTVWSDGSVSIKFNPGKFAVGSTAYLYVTDANNSTSVGKPVKIGGASVLPNPPTSVRVE